MHEDPINKAQPEDDELWALAVLETFRDALRFRFDGLRPDLIQQRPAGYPQSMVELLSVLQQRELALHAAIDAVIDSANPTLNTNFGAAAPRYVAEPFEALGTLLVLRETSLVRLRRLSAADWERRFIDQTRGQRTLRALIAQVARDEQALLERLKLMRYALHTAANPGVRTLRGGFVPDSTR